MGHEKVVLEWFPVEAERLAAPAALRARLARLAGLAERLRVEWGVSFLLHLSCQELMRNLGRL